LIIPLTKLFEIGNVENNIASSTASSPVGRVSHSPCATKLVLTRNWGYLGFPVGLAGWDGGEFI